MYTGKDRRAFHRFPVELMMEISAEGSEGQKYVDRAELIEISGGGARFITHCDDAYYPGQSLDVTIYLPGTDNIKAHMTGTATVLRVTIPMSPDEMTEGGKNVVAIKFNKRLHFTRE